MASNWRPAGNNVIAGNYLGTDATGASHQGNIPFGVRISTSGNIIGGTAPGRAT